MLSFLKSIVFDFFEDNGPRLAAAISYYTVFSLPPLLLLMVFVTGQIFDLQALQDDLVSQIGGLVGPQGGEQFRGIVENLEAPSGGTLGTVLGMVALLFGATAAFVNLQGALNQIWQIAPDPSVGIVRGFLMKRVLSFLMILGIGALLLVSLLLSTALTTLGPRLVGWLPRGLSLELLSIGGEALSFLVIALLFAAIFKVLPDAVLQWSDVAVGAVVTAVLFTAGRMGFAFYLGRSDIGSAYGAAGSLAVLLLWVYLSANILLFGAEFTQAWVRRRGTGIVPEPGAAHVKIEKVPADE